MKPTRTILFRVIQALENNQNRTRCAEEEFTEAARFGIQDPTNKKRFVTAFSVYEDTKGGFFAYFSEAFKVAARKAWNIKTKDRTASSPNGAKKETK